MTNGVSILSLEDEPKTVKGPLEYLELRGHAVKRAELPEQAREYLRTMSFDLLLLDQRLKVGGRELESGGTDLITELKDGVFGPLNKDIHFVFVTGSETWVEKDKVEDVPGYLGIEVKGGDLTRQLRDRVREVEGYMVDGTDLELCRAPLVILAVGDGPDPDVRSIVPAWDNEREVRFSLSQLPLEAQREPERLAERWFFARVNLGESDPSKLVFHDFEAAEPLDEDDGLA